jgi:hypothetical protein
VSCIFTNWNIDASRRSFSVTTITAMETGVTGAKEEEFLMFLGSKGEIKGEGYQFISMLTRKSSIN